ncbi:MAG: hypothetical protein HY255_00255 [Betaproteobacteria bacterium]|nr:hypothetical protein [Betaproteobacteria bacterium]
MTTFLAHVVPTAPAVRRLLAPLLATLMLMQAGESHALRVRTDDMLMPFPHRVENVHSQHFESHVGDFLTHSSDISLNRRAPAEAKCEGSMLLIAQMTKR